MVIPAVLPASRQALLEALSVIARIPRIERVQIDVVDGMFASPASWPYSAKATQGTPSAAPVGDRNSHRGGGLEALRDMAARGERLPHLGRIQYEIDLMCFDAEEAACQWLALGATRLTFHLESIQLRPQFFEQVQRRYGAHVPSLISYGLALNLGTDPSLLEPHLPHVQYVQFMGIAKIGRQGERFDRRVLDQIRRFRARHAHMPVQVDGGVSLATAPLLIEAGATDLVVGSAILAAKDPAAALAAFEALESSYGV